MTVVLSLLAAVSWGAGDFLGGVASRHGRSTAVAVASQAAGLVAALILSPLVGGSPTAADLYVGTLAGVSGGVGLMFLYRGMAAADLAAIVPVAAIGTGVFPMIVGLATGETLVPVEMAGLITALVAVWLVSGKEGSTVGSMAGLLYGLGAGVGFGGLLIGLSFVGPDAGIWPLVPTRIAGVAIVSVIALGLREPMKPPAASWRALVPAGSLGVVGNALFLFATQEGSLAVAAVVGSLFPAVTVLLGRLVLNERLTRRRLLGVAGAVLAVSLISLG